MAFSLIKTLHATQRAALVSVFASIATLTLKFGAYYVTGSVSLYSDALESVVNVAASLVAFGVLTVALLPADDNHTYGHHKAEYFSSGVEGLLIMLAAVLIIYAAIDRLLHPHPLAQIWLGVGIAAVAGMVNLVTARMLLKTARQHDSITLEADAKHLLSDVWTTVGVVLGLSIIYFMPSWQILDPVIAVIFAGNIIYTGVGLIKRSLDGLMDAALPSDEAQRLKQLIAANLPSHAAFHALKTRKAGSRRFIEFHLTVPGENTVSEAHDLCDLLEDVIERELPSSSVTIHLEPRETHGEHAF